LKESTTRRQTLIDSASKDEKVDVDKMELESTYNAAAVGLIEYVKQGKDRLTRLVQEFDASKTKYSLQTEADLIKQICMVKETADTNIKDELKFSIENETVEQLMRKPVHGKFYGDLGRPSLEKYLVWLCSSSLKGEMESLTILRLTATLVVVPHCYPTDAAFFYLFNRYTY
jgi:hypothetical protein